MFVSIACHILPYLVFFHCMSYLVISCLSPLHVLSCHIVFITIACHVWSYHVCLHCMLWVVSIYWPVLRNNSMIHRIILCIKVVLRIISSTVWDIPYPFALLFFDLESLHQRRINLGKKFFGSICNSGSCLNHLLPHTRNVEIISRLRHPRTYPTPYTLTQCSCSFINYAVINYQRYSS